LTVIAFIKQALELRFKNAIHHMIPIGGTQSTLQNEKFLKFALTN